MKYNLIQDKNYKAWLADIKSKVRNAQLKAAVAVNTQLLEFYWELGADIIEKQKNAKWGDGFLQQLSKDLMAEFPEMQGFSYRNLRAIKQWFLFYSKEQNKGLIWQQSVAKTNQQPVGQLVKQPVALITQIPWGHNIVIISKCKTVKEALYYGNVR